MNHNAYTGYTDPISCQSNQVRGEDAVRSARKTMKKKTAKRKLKLKRKLKIPFGDYFPNRFTRPQWRDNRRGAI